MILGTPGGSLDGSFGANRRALSAGRDGERRTAEVLAVLEATNPGIAVLHSLRLPSGRLVADVDHAVVAGRRVWLVDSKCWAPGTYWSLAGRCFRGARPLAHGARHTLAVASRAVAGALRNAGVAADLAEPLVVVWASSGRVRLWGYRPAAGRAMTGERLAERAGDLFGRTPASPEVVAVLARLVRRAA